jgi:hypothetical protein
VLKEYVKDDSYMTAGITFHGIAIVWLDWIFSVFFVLTNSKIKYCPNPNTAAIIIKRVIPQKITTWLLTVSVKLLIAESMNSAEIMGIIEKELYSLHIFRILLAYH